MTKPTQAQIEAAANAMIDKMFAPHELPIDGELWCKYYETAQAALTAAGESAPMQAQIDIRHLRHAIEQILVWADSDAPAEKIYAIAKAAITAAEGVGVTVEQAEILTAQERNSIIERCAQVAGEQYNPAMVEKILAAEKATPEATVKPGELMDYLDAPTAAEAEPKPAQSQIEAVKDTLRRLVILTGDSPWDWDDVARKVLAAAAEVGPYAGMQVNKDGLVLKYTDKDLQDTEDATIERCIEVCKDGTWCGDYYAAEIRALKEKPWQPAEISKC